MRRRLFAMLLLTTVSAETMTERSAHADTPPQNTLITSTMGGSDAGNQCTLAIQGNGWPTNCGDAIKSFGENVSGALNQNLNLIRLENTTNDDQTTAIETNQQNISNNDSDIFDNKQATESNLANITANTGNITTNTNNISTNSDSISDNITALGAQLIKIDNNKALIDSIYSSIITNG